MPNLEVGTYNVGHTRLPDGGWMYLTLEPAPSYDGPIDGVSIYFFENPSDAGYETSSWVVSTPEQSWFEGMYHTLQTEDPVYFSWAANPSTNRLHWSGLGSREEPPGEGFEDHSP